MTESGDALPAVGGGEAPDTVLPDLVVTDRVITTRALGARQSPPLGIAYFKNPINLQFDAAAMVAQIQGAHRADIDINLLTVPHFRPETLSTITFRAKDGSLQYAEAYLIEFAVRFGLYASAEAATAVLMATTPEELVGDAKIPGHRTREALAAMIPVIERFIEAVRSPAAE